MFWLRNKKKNNFQLPTLNLLSFSKQDPILFSTDMTLRTGHTPDWKLGSCKFERPLTIFHYRFISEALIQVCLFLCLIGFFTSH